MLSANGLRSYMMKGLQDHCVMMIASKMVANDPRRDFCVFIVGNRHKKYRVTIEREPYSQEDSNE